MKLVIIESYDFRDAFGISNHKNILCRNSKTFLQLHHKTLHKNMKVRTMKTITVFTPFVRSATSLHLAKEIATNI